MHLHYLLFSYYLLGLLSVFLYYLFFFFFLVMISKNKGLVIYILYHITCDKNIQILYSLGFRLQYPYTICNPFQSGNLPEMSSPDW